MKKKKFLALFLVALVIALLNGCSAGAGIDESSLDISVVDLSTNAPVQGVTLLVSETGTPNTSDSEWYSKSFVTDANGKIYVKGLIPNKTYTVKILSTDWEGYSSVPEEILVKTSSTTDQGDQNAAAASGFMVVAGENYPVIIKVKRKEVPGTGSIRGTVKDTVTGEPIKSAIVTAVLNAADAPAGTQTTFSTTTDSQGNYTLTNLPTGNYTVTVNAAGYPSTSTNTAGNTNTEGGRADTGTGTTLTTTVYTNLVTTLDFSLAAGAGTVSFTLYCPQGLTPGIHATIWLDAIGSKPIKDINLSIQDSGNISQLVTITDVPALPPNTTHKYVLQITSPYFNVTASSHTPEFTLQNGQTVSLDTIQLEALRGSLHIKIIGKVYSPTNTTGFTTDEFNTFANYTTLNITGVGRLAITPTNIHTEGDWLIAEYDVPNIPSGQRKASLSFGTATLAGDITSTGTDILILPDSAAGADGNTFVSTAQTSGG